MEKINLPKPKQKGNVSVEEAITKRRSVRSYSSKQLTDEQIGQLLWACQGITSTRGFRAAPSAGARYPLEVYLFKDDGSREVQVVGEDIMTEDGHCSYLSGNEWILCDTYPDENRLQHVFLFHIASGKKVPLGYFYLTQKYKGELRIDTHPRYSPDDRCVVIDSAHGGCGRQMYLIDISKITGKK